MKKSILIGVFGAGFLLSNIGVAHAWWEAVTKTKVYDREVLSYVYNDKKFTILKCEGIVSGTTKSGRFQKEFSETYIHPKQYGALRLDNKLRSPFASGWSNVVCMDTGKTRHCMSDEEDKSSCISHDNEKED